MDEKVYMGIFKDDEQVGVFEFNRIEDVIISFVDGLHDLGYVLKKIPQEEYKSFSEGDELTIEEFVQVYQSHIK
jgi:hypothetical protein